MPRLRLSLPICFRRADGRFSRSTRMRHRSPLLFLLLLLWSAILGWMAQTGAAQTGTVDVVPQRYQLGQQLYLEKCATCHVGLPPAVMPTQTWANLLPDSQHYGATIQPLLEPNLKIAWNYVSTYSRPIIQRERVPYRLAQSRYFKALHPKVEFTGTIGVGSCVSCHPGAPQFDYRTLTSEWQNAP